MGGEAFRGIALYGRPSLICSNAGDRASLNGSPNDFQFDPEAHSEQSSSLARAGFRTQDSNTDTVDSNRMFKKHNPRRMMMNGPRTQERVPKPSRRGIALSARRRLTKSLMNDVATPPSSASTRPNRGPLLSCPRCVFIFARNIPKCQRQ